MHACGHYSDVSLNYDVLAKFGSWGAAQLMEQLTSPVTPPLSTRDRILLVFRGMSGTTTGTAVGMALQSEYGYKASSLYVRRRNESGQTIGFSGNLVTSERSYPSLRSEDYINRLQLVFVDDFIGGGTTLSECRAQMFTRCDQSLRPAILRLWDEGWVMTYNGASPIRDGGKCFSFNNMVGGWSIAGRETSLWKNPLISEEPG